MVNDSLGHEVGDRLLQEVAERMSGALRTSDTLARFGGDEFTVLCEDVTDEAHALKIANRIAATMREPLTVAGGETFVSFSMGIALSTNGEESVTILLRRADIAMYRAKKGGPSRVEVYTDDDKCSISRLRISDDLHRTVERDELELCYQPYVDLRSRTMIGLKVSVQWRHPTRGLLPADEFIPLAEQIGLIVPIGAWILGEACRRAAAWSEGRTRAGFEEDRLNIAIRLSAPQLADPGFCDLVAAVLDTTGIDPDRLWLELTESNLMRDADAALGNLRSLRDLGLHLGISGFGTGYSSLGYLKRLPVETLTIDRSFVGEMDRDADDLAVVRTVIGLGESMGWGVIAEGVERGAQVHLLQTLGCHLAHGELFGAPLTADDVGAFPTDDLKAWRGLVGATAS